MSNSDSGETGDEHWDERGELAWNEFDWERYLRNQEGAVSRYLRLYEEAGERPGSDRPRRRTDGLGRRGLDVRGGR